MNATLYSEVDGQIFQNCTVTMENIIPAFEVRGYVATGVNNNPRQRAELQGWPLFSELVGPMWNGELGVRYETAKVNERLSA